MDIDNAIVSAVADAVASAVKLGPPPPPLPAGWVIKQSRASPGYYYYFNMESGLATWTPPARPMSPGQQQQAAEEEKEQSGVDSATAPPGGAAVPSPPKDPEEKDPEDSEDRSSKRRKPAESVESASGGGKKSGPKEVRVLHILKKHKNSRRPSSWRQAKITQTVEEAKEELEGILEILQEEQDNPDELRATFEELARTESDCSSAKRGGDLGYFGRRKMQPNFEAASFALEVGELTKEVVETSSGVHLILRIG